LKCAWCCHLLFFTITCSRKSHKYGYNIWSQTCVFLKWNVFLEIVYFFLKLVLSKGQLLRNSKVLLKCSIMLKCHWCVLINLKIIITNFCNRTFTKIEYDSTQRFLSPLNTHIHLTHMYTHTLTEKSKKLEFHTPRPFIYALICNVFPNMYKSFQKIKYNSNFLITPILFN